jgi:Immunity protein 26/Regulator of ribonuclease activity B
MVRLIGDNRIVTAKRRYKEGDWFAVPLRNGGYAAGFVARAPVSGHILLGYFFGPRRSTMPRLTDLTSLCASDAVLVARFYDTSLEDGSWKVLGWVAPWDRQQWPMVDWGRQQGNIYLRVRYPDDNPNGLPIEQPIPYDQFTRLPADTLCGAGAVEIDLSRLLPGGDPSAPMWTPTAEFLAALAALPEEDLAPQVDHFLYFDRKAAARAVAKRLQDGPYRCVVEAADDQWLLRVTHDALPPLDDLDEVEALLTRLATEAGGAYEGFERDV